MIKNREIHEECGVLGIFNAKNCSNLMYYGLHALQHRGQEACGIVTVNNKNFKVIKGKGLIIDNFNEKNLLDLSGTMGIGHVKYDNISNSGLSSIQPFLFRHHTGDFAIAHNGKIVNSNEVRNKLENEGSLFQSNSDAELVAHMLIKDNPKTMLSAIKESMCQIEGGFAFLMMTNDTLYACRDKHGLRPLSLGQINGSYVVASETCAFDIIGATLVSDLIPGEIIEISSQGIKSTKYSNYSHHYMCAMEYAYFARPDSDLEGINVHTFRRDTGIALAKEYPVDADIVVGVPDSSLSAAIGYAEESKLRYETGIIKNRYIGRTFIQPDQHLREKTVSLKHSAIASVIKDKRIVLVDDSIVRGTTCKKIVKMLKQSGAKEVHVRIGTPQITHPCFYGVDFSTYEEIIGATKTKNEIRIEIGADSLEFLPEQAFLNITNRKELCLSCFNGKYPTNIYQALKEANKN